jgi:hypothetical protein
MCKKVLKHETLRTKQWAEPVPDSTKGKAGDVRSRIVVKETYP